MEKNEICETDSFLKVGGNLDEKDVSAKLYELNGTVLALESVVRSLVRTLPAELHDRFESELLNEQEVASTKLMETNQPLPTYAACHGLIHRMLAVVRVARARELIVPRGE